MHGTSAWTPKTIKLYLYFININMVKVSIATPDHQEAIATMLSNYYSRLNEVYGFEKYKTDKDIMLKHVSRRISTSDSEFKYFVALDNNDNIIGFINIYIRSVCRF